jgi:hypothetical protein
LTNVCGAAGEQAGAGDGKSDADVLIVCEERTQHHKEDGKRAIEGVNDEIIECIAAYQVMVKESTGGQEPVGFEGVLENVQVYQIISYYFVLLFL